MISSSVIMISECRGLAVEEMNIHFMNRYEDRLKSI